MSGQFTWDGLARFVVGMLAAAAVFASFLIIVQSLSFWLGMLPNLSGLAVNAIITFGIYPITLFDNTAKFILFTIIPAALMGAIPADFIHAFTWRSLGILTAGAIIFLLAALTIFRLGLKRYESGNAMQVEV